MKIMAFCETYCVGGGSRYALDCLEALPDIYSEIILATNNPSFFYKDVNNASKRMKIIQVPFLSYNRIGIFINKSWFKKTILARLLLKVCHVIQPIFLYMNFLNFVQNS